MNVKEQYDYIVSNIFNPVEGKLVGSDNYELITGAEEYENGGYYCLTKKLFDEFKENTKLEEIIFIRLSFIISEKPYRVEYKEEVNMKFSWDVIDKESKNIESLFYVFFSHDLRSIFFSFHEGWALIKHY